MRRTTVSGRFHSWLEDSATYLVGRILRRPQEEFITYANAKMMADLGIMVKSEFTNPVNYRRYLVTRVEWEEDDSVEVARVYGKELR